MRFIRCLRMPGLLSFPPDMGSFDLQSPSVLLDANESGMSNTRPTGPSKRSWIESGTTSGRGRALRLATSRGAA